MAASGPKRQVAATQDNAGNWRLTGPSADPAGTTVPAPFQKVGLNGYDGSFWPLGTSMRRREFITLLGGAATWPLSARAQQPERMRRIGAFAGIDDDAEGQARFAAFLQGLQQLGWTDGRNLRIDYRWGGGNADNIRKYAAELAALAPDVILVAGAAAVGPLLQATRT